MPKKRRKLTPREQKLASKYIAEEFRTGKYGDAQAKAIGIARAKRQAKLQAIKKRHRIR
jgi:hypothetical protein